MTNFLFILPYAVGGGTILALVIILIHVTTKKEF